MSKNKMVLIGSTILLLILSPRFVVKAEEINSNTIVDMDNQGKPDFLMVDGFPNICTKNIMTAPNSNEPLESEKSKPPESGANANRSSESEKSKSSASEPNANQSSESEKTKSPESGESANQSSESEKSKSSASEPNANQSSESEKTKSPESETNANQPSASEPNINQPTESSSNTNQSIDFDKENDNLNVSNEVTEMPSDNIEENIIQSIDTNQFVESDNNKDVEENNEISDENGFNLISLVAEYKSSKQKRYDVLKVIPTKNINYDWQLSALNTVILTFIILTGIYGIFILLPMVQTLIWINRKQTMLLSKMGNYKNYE